MVFSIIHILSFDINAFFTVGYNHKVSKSLLYREILRLLYQKEFRKTKKVFRSTDFIQMNLYISPLYSVLFTPVI